MPLPSDEKLIQLGNDLIEPSDDPLLELRAAIYLLSGRRQAPESQSQASSTG